MARKTKTEQDEVETKNPKCDGKRPTEGKAETVNKKKWELGELPADMKMAIVVYAGCIEGPRETYAVGGDEREVFAYGTAKQVIEYTIGEKVKIGEKEFQRNIGRKQQQTVERIRSEMKGGVQTQRDRFEGYTITVNGKKITANSLINTYFEKKDFPTKKEGAKPLPYMGGVEMIVSAIIKPGDEPAFASDMPLYHTLDKRL